MIVRIRIDAVRLLGIAWVDDEAGRRCLQVTAAATDATTSAAVLQALADRGGPEVGACALLCCGEQGGLRLVK